MSKLKPKHLTETTWETQAGKFTTSEKVNVDFCLLESSGTKIVSFKCHVDRSTNSRYNMILGRYLLTTLGLYLKFAEKSSWVVMDHLRLVPAQDVPYALILWYVSKTIYSS